MTLALLCTELFWVYSRFALALNMKYFFSHFIQSESESQFFASLCRYTPDISLMVVVLVLVVTSAWIREASGAAVLLADGILVDRGVGLRCAVVGRWNAVTGFTAIVTVSIIHSTIWVLIYTEAQEDMVQKEKIGLF